MKSSLASSDDVQKYHRQCQELGSQCQDRGHVQAIQKSHGRQARRQECVEWRHGHIEGGGEESVAETVRRLGRCTGHHQTVLLRWWQWFEEDILGEITGTAKFTIRSEFVHANNRYPNQNLYYKPSARR